MFKQGENRINYLGSALFALLIYLVLFAFAENPGKDQDVRSDYQVTSGLLFSEAVVIEAHQIDFLNNLLPGAGSFKFKLSNETTELISLNYILLHKIIFLEKTGLLIKPLVHHRFYYQVHNSDIDDPPLLS